MERLLAKEVLETEIKVELNRIKDRLNMEFMETKIEVDTVEFQEMGTQTEEEQVITEEIKAMELKGKMKDNMTEVELQEAIAEIWPEGVHRSEVTYRNITDPTVAGDIL
ncbi:hypothetical protein WA026_005348 [Henosepilachna vigintioctopunctata]|uniref:Uncharacterized protein n=1 Tax=Henosepilachna vigintioctopunctata TaxID=420089 RepID=A0AAW1TUN7_9CUCU